MAVINIRTFKGLNNVADPSFLDEAGGQAVWAKNADFSSGKVQPLPDSEIVLTLPEDYPPADPGSEVPTAYQGNYLTEEARTNVWGLNDIYSVSPWVLGQDIFYYLLSHTGTNDFYIYRGTIADPNPVPSPIIDFRKTVGVPLPVPDVTTPVLVNNEPFSRPWAISDTFNYAISFSQNHFGRIEEGPLKFLDAFSGFSVFNFSGSTDFSGYLSTGIFGESGETSPLKTVKSSTLTSIDPVIDSSPLTPTISGKRVGETLELRKTYHGRSGFYYDIEEAISWEKKGSVALRLKLPNELKFTDNILFAVTANPESVDVTSSLLVQLRPELGPQLFKRDFSSSAMQVKVSDQGVTNQLLLFNSVSGDVDFTSHFVAGDYFLLGGHLGYWESTSGTKIYVNYADHFIGKVLSVEDANKMHFEIVPDTTIAAEPWDQWHSMVPVASPTPHSPMGFTAANVFHFSIMKFLSIENPRVLFRFFKGDKTESTLAQLEDSSLFSLLQANLDHHAHIAISWDLESAVPDLRYSRRLRLDSDPQASGKELADLSYVDSSGDLAGETLGSAKLTLLGEVGTSFSQLTEYDDGAAHGTGGNVLQVPFRPYGAHSLGTIGTTNGNPGDNSYTFDSPSRWEWGNIFPSKLSLGFTTSLDVLEVVVSDKHTLTPLIDLNLPKAQDQVYDLRLDQPDEPTTPGDGFFPGATDVVGYTTHWNVYRLFNGEYLKAAKHPFYAFIPSSLVEGATFNLFADAAKVGNTKVAFPVLSDYSSNAVFELGDVVATDAAGSTQKFYRYLGSREFNVRKGSGFTAGDNIITFKNSPTLDTEIESVFIASDLNLDYWEEVGYDLRHRFYDETADSELGDQSDSFFTSSITGALINTEAPQTELDGIIDRPFANMMFAWKGSTLYWTETLLGHSWSSEAFYRLFPDEIMGVVGGSDQLVVVTRTSLHSSNQTNPEEMTFLDITNVGALGKFAVSNWEGNPVFLSHRGLFLFRGGSYVNLTKDSMPEDVFRASVEGITNRDYTVTRGDNPCVGVFYNLIFFYLPNSGMFVHSLDRQDTTPVPMPLGPDQLPLSVKLIHDFYEDKVVAVSDLTGSSQIVYTVLLDPFVAPPGLAYSEFTVQSADLDLNRTDWKSFESLQFQGNGSAEVSLLGPDEVISSLTNLDPLTNSNGEGFVFLVTQPIYAPTVAVAETAQFNVELTGGNSDEFEAGDLVQVVGAAGIGTGQAPSRIMELQLYSDPNATLHQQIGILTENSATTSQPNIYPPGTGIEDEQIIAPVEYSRQDSINVSGGIRKPWKFKAGSVVVVKDTAAVIKRKSYKYKGDKVLDFSVENNGVLVFKDSPSSSHELESIIKASALNSDFWEESSCLARQKIFDIGDQFGSVLGQGIIGDSIILPPYQILRTGDILHGKLRNGRQYWAQYLGDKLSINNTAAARVITLAKALSANSVTEAPAVCIFEDQIYAPYLGVFPYQGHSIDFTTLEGSRVGVPFDYPTDRLSFIIKGTGKIVGATVNGF